MRNKEGEHIMFVILTTKPLNDGTKGFHFNFFGKKGLARLRKRKTTGWFKRTQLENHNAYHFGRLIIYLRTRYALRKFGHIAG